MPRIRLVVMRQRHEILRDWSCWANRLAISRNETPLPFHGAHSISKCRGVTSVVVWVSASQFHRQ